MCGIVGKINFNNKEIKKEEMINMLQVLRHRGPDGSNIYINRNIGLGHVLLKIQDLSDDSLQPFEYKNYIILSENELFKTVQSKKKYKTSFKYSAKIKNLSNIEIGDYVVHDAKAIA